MDDTRVLISQLLKTLGSQKEVEKYLKQFSSLNSTQFAVIKVGGQIIQEQLDALVSSLSFLTRVGLYPIVIHGGGPQLNEALEDNGHEVSFVEGKRVTDATTLRLARKVFPRVTYELTHALEKYGTHARPITTGVFTASLLSEGKLGYVGRITQVDLEPIQEAIAVGAIPVLASFAETQDGQLLNINADTATRHLAKILQPYKVIFLTETGGLLGENKAIISSVNLAEDFEALMEAPWLSGGMRLKIAEIESMLRELPPTTSVALTRPSELPKELFTHKGAGTLIKLGEPLLSFAEDRLPEIDLPLLKQLLEASFKRELSPNYFEEKRFSKIYLTEGYRAAALLTKSPFGPYLDKFAVTPDAQGEGLSATLWAKIKRDEKRLFWRSRKDNHLINSWYFSKSDGAMKAGPWIIFWYGTSDFRDIEGMVGYCLKLPASLAPPK